MPTGSVNKREKPEKSESSNDAEVGNAQIPDHPLHSGHKAFNYMHIHFIK